MKEKPIRGINNVTLLGILLKGNAYKMLIYSNIHYKHFLLIASAKYKNYPYPVGVFFQFQHINFVKSEKKFGQYQKRLYLCIVKFKKN